MVTLEISSPTPFDRVFLFVCLELILYSLLCVATEVSFHLAQWCTNDWLEISLNVLGQYASQSLPSVFCACWDMLSMLWEFALYLSLISWFCRATGERTFSSLTWAVLCVFVAFQIFRNMSAFQNPVCTSHF